MKGLILAGGAGSRLGTEKAFLNLHGESQVSWLTAQFKKAGLESWVAIPEHKKNLFGGFNLIFDAPGIPGPLAGIAAAFQLFPGPWIIAAVDMPYFTNEVITYMIQNRRGGIATCLSSDGENLEPMASLWEPDAFPKLLKFIDQGGESASEFLKSNSPNLLKIKSENWIYSINTPDELEWAKKEISS